jgi:broad specificity phosphatase PhoE
LGGLLWGDAMPRVLFVARHGETEWNVHGRWQGHTDIPLNDRGRAQARELAAVLRPHGLAGAVSSDLSRARETAEIVASALGFALAYQDAGLRERGFGIFEGLTREQCEQQHPAAWQAWQKDRLTPAGAETKEALAARVVTAAERVARQVATHDAPALLVTHGGALRALVEVITGTLPPFVENGDVWRLTYAGDAFVEARQV